MNNTPLAASPWLNKSIAEKAQRDVVGGSECTKVHKGTVQMQRGETSSTGCPTYTHSNETETAQGPALEMGSEGRSKQEQTPAPRDHHAHAPPATAIRAFQPLTAHHAQYPEDRQGPLPVAPTWADCEVTKC